MAALSLEDLLKSVNQNTKLAMRAIDELNSGSRNKFPTQKEISREELVKVCQIWRKQLLLALEKQGEEEKEEEDEFADASDGDNTHSQNSQTVDGTRTTDSTGPSSQEGTEEKRVCTFHKWKECKNKEKCRYLHPKICQKYLWYGLNKTDPKDGCNKTDCDLYHPPLCYGSMKYKECRVKRCKKRHLPDTKFSAKEVKDSKKKNKSTSNKKKGQKSKPNGSTRTPGSKKSQFSREPKKDQDNPRETDPQSSGQGSQGPPAMATNPPFLGGMTPGYLEQRLLQIERVLFPRPAIGNHLAPQGAQFFS